MPDKYYQNDVGTVVRLNCGTDISGATGTTMKVQKPDGTVVSWTATVFNSNYLTYTTVAGDLDQVGVYTIQSSLTLSGWTGLGKAAQFEVYAAYD